MYKEEIKEIFSQKRESCKLIMKDLINLYIKLKIGYPNLKKEQDSIKYLIRFYLNYDSNESYILKEITKKFGNLDYNKDIEIILEELDIIYNYYYNYMESVQNNYDIIIRYTITDIVINRIKGNNICIDDYKYRLKLPKIEKILDKEKILNKVKGI